MTRRAQTGPGLFADPAQHKRRTELAVDKAIRSAQQAGLVDKDLDAAAAALARDLAKAVGQAIVKQDPYGVTQAGRQLADVLDRLGLTPRARNGGSTDEVLEAIRELGRPSVTE